MNCDDDYVNTPEKYKCLGNTIDGNIFNKHNDQEKKDISIKDLFYLHGIYSIQTSLFYSHLVILTLKSIPPVFMYAMNIQNDVIGLVLRENCKSKQMTDIIA